MARGLQPIQVTGALARTPRRWIGQKSSTWEERTSNHGPPISKAAAAIGSLSHNVKARLLFHTLPRFRGCPLAFCGRTILNHASSSEPPIFELLTFHRQLPTKPLLKIQRCERPCRPNPTAHLSYYQHRRCLPPTRQSILPAYKSTLPLGASLRSPISLASLCFPSSKTFESL